MLMSTSRMSHLRDLPQRWLTQIVVDLASVRALEHHRRGGGRARGTVGRVTWRC